jgi:hypothetical protein
MPPFDYALPARLFCVPVACALARPNIEINRRLKKTTLQMFREQTTSEGDLIARPALGGRMICESCPSIDMRQWHRQGRLFPGQQFSWLWTRGAEPVGSITVRAEDAAVVLSYRSCRPGSSEWKSNRQWVPIRLTACHFGSVRPWFVCPAYCNGRHCGRRAGILYFAGELFACRRCHGLSYASQQQTPLDRRLEQARKIRMRLGGGVDLLEPLPGKPKGMHRRTFLRLQARAEAAMSGR